MEIGSMEKWVMLRAGAKGAAQANEFKHSAEQFWEEYRPRLANELEEELSVPTYGLVDMTEAYAKEILVPSIQCSEQEITDFQKHLNEKGCSIKELSGYFSNRATSLQFVQLLLMPGLAYAKGLGDMDENNARSWLTGVGLLYPLSSDVADDALDCDYPSYPRISYKELRVFYKLAAPALLQLGKKYYSKTSTGDAILDRQLRIKLDEALREVSEGNKKDLEAKKRKDVTMEELFPLYNGKIAAVEREVFNSVPSKKRNIVDIFEEGAGFLAFAIQLRDDYDDLLGDPENKTKPSVPNPSFFLTFFRDYVRSGERDYLKAFRKAAEDTKKVASKQFDELKQCYDRIPDSFETKPFFKSITALFEHKYNRRHEEVMRSKTLPDILAELQTLL